MGSLLNPHMGQSQPVPPPTRHPTALHSRFPSPSPSHILPNHHNIFLDELNVLDVDDALGNIDQESDNPSGQYQQIGLPVILSMRGEESGSNTDLTAIAIIFVIISILCGIVCFIAGSGIGGLCCYQRGKKVEKERIQRIDHSS